MTKFFRILAESTDTEGNNTRENIQVKATEAFADIPTVSYRFP
jgi:hypothetical protein